jgi:DNA adenine methylase
MVTRSFLRWAGSKQQLLPQLSNYWNPSFGRYVEPFAGSASLFFRLKPRKALLSDLNSELILTYLEVKYRYREVVSELSMLDRSKKVFLEQRSLSTVGMSRTKIAARFIFLNRLCFNGLYRTNNSGVFNVPYGGDKSGNMPSLEAIRSCSAALRCATLRDLDFQECLDRTHKGDFVFLDPPYAVDHTRVFREYQAKTFSTDDLERLGQELVSLDLRGVKFVISYSNSPEGRELLKQWNPKPVRVQRNIAGFASDRKVAYELLGTNIIQ